MADQTITQLSLGTDLLGPEELPVWQSSATKKQTINNVRALPLNPTPVTAAGTDQSGATVLSNSYWVHLVGTVGTGAGVKFAPITATAISETRFIACLATAANDLSVYPPSGGKINDQPVNTPILVERGITGHFISVSTVDWRSIG